MNDGAQTSFQSSLRSRTAPVQRQVELCTHCVAPCKKGQQKSQDWLFSPGQFQLLSSTFVMGTAFPKGLRGTQKFLMVTLMEASSSCVDTRKNGFPVLVFLQAGSFEHKPAPDWGCCMQQHCQIWVELANSSHIHWAKLTELPKNPTACFGVMFSPHSRAAAERDLFLLGGELVLSEAGIRWTVTEPAIKVWGTSSCWAVPPYSV